MRNNDLGVYHRLNQTTDPSASDDYSEGLNRGSKWQNGVSGRWFICTDNTVDSADWIGIATLDDLAGIEADITGLEATVAGHTTQIGNNTTNITNLTTAISVLQNRSYGEMYFSTPVDTTGIAAGTYKIAAGTTTAGLSSDFTHSTNELIFTGAGTKRFEVIADGKVGGNLGTVTVALYKISGGVGTNVRTSASTASVTVLAILYALTEGNFAINALVDLATNDSIRLYITTSVGTTARIKEANVVIKEI